MLRYGKQYTELDLSMREAWLKIGQSPENGYEGNFAISLSNMAKVLTPKR